MMNQEKKPENERLSWVKTQERQTIKTPWMDLREQWYRFPDGSEHGPFYAYARRNFVVTAARTEEGKFLCVRQFRNGVEHITTEFPAGGIEDFDLGKRQSSREAALAAAKRELCEETGYESDDWHFLFSCPANSTWSNNYAYLFFADSCRKTGTQHLDVTEFIDVVSYTPQELDKLIADGGFEQITSILTWKLAKEYLSQKEIRS